MFSIEEVNSILDEVASGFPEELFVDLNGGVSLVPDVKRNYADANGGLYILGEYRRDQMGRYIVLYYGSICRVHGESTREELFESMKKLLSHEITHHIESLAGERGLEIKDRRDLEEYLRGG